MRIGSEKRKKNIVASENQTCNLMGILIEKESTSEDLAEDNFLKSKLVYFHSLVIKIYLIG